MIGDARDIGGEPVEAAPHVDGLQRQIDFHARRELKHQKSPSADRTRRSASASTSASSDTRAPFGSLISIAPRRACLRGAATGLLTAGGANAGDGAGLSSKTVTGTNVGATPSCAEAEASAAFAVPRCRSSHPSRERRIHLKTRLAFQSVPTRNCCNGRLRRQSFIDNPLALTKAPRPPRPRQHRCQEPFWLENFVLEKSMG